MKMTQTLKKLNTSEGAWGWRNDALGLMIDGVEKTLELKDKKLTKLGREIRRIL